MSTSAQPLATAYAPPNGNGAAPPRGAEPSAPAMRPPPPRGDRQALKYWAFGVAAYALFSATLVFTLAFRGGRFSENEVAQLVGLGDHPNPAVTLLVALGAVVTVIAAVRALRDIGLMRKEEDDVEWLWTTGEPGIDLVFLDGPDRQRLFDARRRDPTVAVPARTGTVETLLDERVRRVQISLASAEGGVVVPAELRGIAEVRTAAYGAFARYASSLLLLLAVLGTFAGVKTALPELIAAVGSETNNTAGLVSALSAVASAFGGNALALVGAVSVGLMAQGVSLGRRNLLERLELVSAEYLYGRTVAAEASPMQSAMVALRDTAREMQSASGAMLGIEGGLNSLSVEFRGSLDGLGDRLREIVARQEQGMYDRTADALVDLQRRLESLARGVDANTQVYAGLAEAVGTRSRDTAEALRQMRETNQQLAKALEGVVAAGQQTATAFGQLQGAVQELKRGSEGADARLGALTDAVGKMGPTFEALGRTLASADDRLRASEAGAREQWVQVGAQVTRQLGEAVEGFRALDQRAAATLEQVGRTAVARAGAGSDPEVPRLLRELVAASGGRKARPAWQAAAVPFAAAAAGVALGGAGTYYLAVRPAQQQAAAVEQLQPTLDRLGAAVERLGGPPPPRSVPPDSAAGAAGAAAASPRARN